MTANEIRESFVKYFEQQGHLIVPSAPMVIKDDPTLMFTNAGMNQFKDIILGNVEPKCRRQTDSQKCLRVSGKHNDLEEVGHDTYHHTMFEMLGNWSFGDYFKKEAIKWAYEYLVKVLKIDPAHLYVTVFEGSPEEGLERDNEAAGYWEEYFPKDHIVNGNKHDNFWEMGDTGPCGPCSEIHIDSRTDEERAASGIKGADLVNKDNPQVIEIWNIVFMQYNRKADGSLEPLPNKVIDTGMGFERLVRVMQGKHSNYDTDVFTPYLRKIGELSGHEYGKDEQVDIAMRVIADHLRAISFAIADGQLPGNAKAGYVIRRILRRAVRYAYTFLGQREAFLCRLLPTLVQEMGAAYPELPAQQELIGKVIREEEESFLRTLSTGISLLEKLIAQLKATVPSASPEGSTPVLPGEKAFTLFDTYGFPLDLTQLICSEQGITVDEAGFNVEMQKQKERARNAAAVEATDWVVVNGQQTTDNGQQTETHYLDTTEHTCRILKYRRVEQKKRAFYEIVLDHTPFYAEMGGQVGDQGVLVSEGQEVRILDTKRENNLPIHITDRMPEHPEVEWMACVDTDRRHASEANHTATHLLDQALREVLGTHVEQKGSLVSPDGLRFDFSHFQKVTPEELRQVERLVNERIRQNIPLQDHRDVPIEEAKKLGAMALFGEKYGDRVRVVQFADSIEFCGGCHAHATGEIGLFRILSESSVAAGVRRIEAITGMACVKALNDADKLEKAVAETLKTQPGELLNRSAAVMEELKEERRTVEKLQDQLIRAEISEILAGAKEIGGLRVAAVSVGNQAADWLRSAGDRIREKDSAAVVVLAAVNGEKLTFQAVCGKDAVAKGVKAGDIIKNVTKIAGGSGGGKPDSAMGGGKDVSKLDEALKSVEGFVASKLG